MAGFMGAVEFGVTARRVLEERDRRAVERQRELLVVARRELPRYMVFINEAVERAAREGKLVCSVNLHQDELENRVFHALLVWELFQAGFGVVERRRVPDDCALVRGRDLVVGAGLVGVDVSWARVWDDLPGPVGPVGVGGRVLDLPKVDVSVDVPVVNPGTPVVAPGMGEPPGMTQDDYPSGRSEPLPDVSGPDSDAQARVESAGDPMG